MPNIEMQHIVPVSTDDNGQRLDLLLAAALPDLSRTRLKALIKDGLISENGATITDPSFRVKCGQTFVVGVPAAVPAEPVAQDIKLNVVYEDEDLIVIDKPAGMVVHPAPGSLDGTLVNALLAHCDGQLSGIGGVARPGIVHRIDKDTSGLMVAAKTDLAHQSLSKQFADHSLERGYKALIWGIPSPPTGRVEGNIGRDPRDRKKMAVVARGGKAAVTHFHVERSVGTLASLVECKLETGRTHQIRVHMASIGHPLVGDPVYGRAPSKKLKNAIPEHKAAVIACKRQALHAYLIGFIHPRSGKCLSFKSDIPNDINALIEVLTLL